jgi:hypothetical protein
VSLPDNESGTTASSAASSSGPAGIASKPEGNGVGAVPVMPQTVEQGYDNSTVDQPAAVTTASADVH